MKLRTQLTVAFVVLAVIPLATIVLYSYVSSQRAFRRAVADETWALAEEIGGRMTAMREDMKRLVDELGSLPVHHLVTEGNGAGDSTEVYSELVAEMQEVATFVEWFTFVPVESTSGEGGCDCDESFLIFPSEALAKALRTLDRYRERGPEALEAVRASLEETLDQAVRPHSSLTPEELQGIAASARATERLLGAQFRTPVSNGDTLVGHLEIHVRPYPLLRQVLSRTRRDDGEIPFAFDRDEGTLFVADPEDKKVLMELAAQANDGATISRAGNDDWIFAEKADPESVLAFGIARPIRASLQGMQRTAVRNFAAGMGMMALALFGVHLLSRRLTRDLDVVTAGAERLASGDLTVRLPELAGLEMGRLARTFNRMTHELSEKERRLLEEEEHRKEQDIRQRLLQAENERRGRELEEARQLQLSLLPKELPRYESLDIAVAMRTATEVGGDYYDFFPGPGTGLTIAIGDATGHGAKAGTLVTAVKGLLSLAAKEPDLPGFLADAGNAIQRMDLDRMSMALMLLRLDGPKLTVSSAGMPPMLLKPAGSEEVQESPLCGTPLGALRFPTYQQWQTELGAGDTILLMSDGFPELTDASGEPLGYERARALFAHAASEATTPAQEIVATLSRAASDWNGGAAPDDDITFVVLKIKH